MNAAGFAQPRGEPPIYHQEHNRLESNNSESEHIAHNSNEHPHQQIMVSLHEECLIPATQAWILGGGAESPEG